MTQNDAQRQSEQSRRAIRQIKERREATMLGTKLDAQIRAALKRQANRQYK